MFDSEFMKLYLLGSKHKEILEKELSKIVAEMQKTNVKFNKVFQYVSIVFLFNAIKVCVFII